MHVEFSERADTHGMSLARACRKFREAAIAASKKQKNRTVKEHGSRLKIGTNFIIAPWKKKTTIKHTRKTH